ncbi:TIGR03773 family transporter-associated surface protein [Actinoplanes missouriensis]|uniref:TIGR03773 family transporter-associated surface protein n=1 Tax=Actinoplanes missouriensis TaxID=1866 RepID=UPI0033FAA4A6
MTRIAALATASLAVVLTAGGPAFAAPPPADGADLIALSVKSGQLRMSFRGPGQAATDPRSVRLTTAGTPAGVIPDDPAFGFLGRPGAPVWSLQEGSPFSTLDTTGIDEGTVTLELADVDGPGSFAAYTLSPWGRPTLLLDSDGRTRATLPAGQRLGGVVWLFDATGEYRVTLRASARSGSRTLKDEALYTVSVPAAAGQKQAAVQQAPASAPKAAAAAGRKVISDGHVDMGPQLSGTKLTIRIKDDTTTPATWRELSDVTLKVTDKAKIDVPAGAGYAFLGKAGEKVHLLPQSQQSGIVWPGWNTQHESVVKGIRGNVVWRLKRVDGPGEFKLFLTGSFGTPEVLFDSAKRLPQQLGIAPNTHAHGNWAFTEAGVYKLTVEMTATTTAGTSVSDTKTLTLAVGDAANTGGGTGADPDPSASAGPGSGSGSGSGSGNGGSGNGNGNGESDGESDGGSGNGGGDLAKTGMNIVSIAGGGALLIAAGAATVALTRRRRNENSGTPS